MALRVLSGVISNADGPVADEVVIGFNPHAVLSVPPSVEVVNLRTVGPDGRFLALPAEHVAIREIEFRIMAFMFMSQTKRFFIGTQTTLDQITIAWSKGSQTIGILPEISYMIIGEVEGTGGAAAGNGMPNPGITPAAPGRNFGNPVTLPGGIAGDRK